MKEGPVIASVAALLGDPARANILTALMDGRALTVSELAEAAGVTLQTASGHLAKLDAANLLTAEKQGRHRYFRLSGPDVAQVLEALMGLAQRTGATRVRTGPKDAALRSARICYDHLAGERGVAMLKRAQRQGLIEGEQDLALTTRGRAFFADFGIDLTRLEKGRRPVCRACLDWSERHRHLGGALGAAILSAMIDRKWVRRDSGRVLTFTCEGVEGFEATFSLA
ncbi:winged helix-turn-helix transcriptional regulator [Microvirga sp. 3-52]|uniref:ArsR/SmtB family transcription factor n=1 Tax=Microvirga sp. 3-52 TaxID=2792425 RepID=UPI001AD17E0B|nr:winged helix-turn-helix domain-containing protein [Microvirga sp. 3-52]MBO1908353.1 winged helix-turn-helix transcriptional regulator [Microvirga sp. 3-52]MBS7454968.1 winged helix-turn-helix transcriptional regulator [Microvirga sp. 3-52]